MRLLPNRRWLWLSFSVLLLTACKKELRQQKRAFKLATETWYRISPAQPEWLTVNGTNYLGILYFPGGGTGNATHLGNCAIYFNQLAYVQPPGTAILGSVAAPLTNIPSYPVASDFGELTAAIASMNIPAKVEGKIVNTVVYNKNGEAIFLSAISGAGSTFPISATQIGFNGKGVIVGGSGKFTTATGEFNYEGYFNPENNNDAAYTAEGWIDY